MSQKLDSHLILNKNVKKGFLMENGILRTAPIKLNESIMNEVTPTENTPVEDIPQKVQLMRTCTFFHPQYGKVDITRQLFDEMISNFEKRVRGIDVMIDYSHESDKEAAGWIKGLEIQEVQLSEDSEEKEAQLWAIVDWTPKGRKTLSDKEYGYLSADFDPDYRDNENPDFKHGAVLLGAGLTNRPVIKKMNPAIQLAEMEYVEESNSQNKEKNKMDHDKDKEMMEQEKENEMLGEIKSLMEAMEVSSIKELMEKIKGMENESKELKEEKMLSEKKSKLDELLKDGKISEAQKTKAMELSEDSFNSFVELAKMSEPVVKLAETGKEETPTEEKEDTRDVEEIIEEKALALSEEKKISIKNAISVVLSENPDLKEKYQQLGNE